MKEIFDIRIMNPSALRKIPETLGSDLDADHKYLPNGRRDPLYFPIKQILIERSDPFFDKLVNIVRKYNILGVTVERIYSENEILQAKAFQMIVNRMIETAGDECGTEYDTSQVCKICGSGVIQKGNLKLHSNKLPKIGGWASTEGDEIIASADISKLVQEHGFSGIEFKPIMRCNSSEAVKDWYQPMFTSKVDIDHENTIMGDNHFLREKSDVYSCGHIAGLNILSELAISGNIGCDFNITSQKKGSGPMIVVSPKVRDLFIENHIKGVLFEVAYVND